MNSVERLLNNTYSENDAHESIYDNKLSNFHYLYDMQKDLIGHRIFDFKLKELHRDMRISNDLLKNKYLLTLPVEFIETSRINRFLRSKFKDKLIDIFEISNNPIFNQSCLMYIDGELFTGFKIFPSGSKTYIVFNDTEYTTDIIGNPESDVTIIILPNLNIISEATNKYLTAKGVNTNKNEKILKTNGKRKYNYIHSISLDNNFGIIMLTRSKNGVVYYSTPIPDSYNNKTFNMNKLGFQHMNGTTMVRRGDTFFEIERKNMPITVENMIVYERTQTGLKYAHGVRVEWFYPNIYKLINHDESKNYYVTHFYYDDTISTDSIKLIYENKFSLLDRIGFSLLDNYIYEMLPDVIANYNPEIIDYSIEDYRISRFTKPIDYKDNTLKNLIDADSKNSSYYFDRNVSYPHKLYLDVSRIDLDSRIRDTTSKETPHNIINFRNPHYVFALKKSIIKNPNQMRVFVDGAIQVYHTTTENQFNVYLYIPCEFIDYFSMIEFESFTDEYITSRFTVKDNEAIIEIDNRSLFCNDDVTITDTTGKLIDRNEYEIWIKKNGQFIQLISTYNTTLSDTLKIVFKSIDDGDYIFNIIHHTIILKQEIVTDDDRGKAVYINKPIDRDLEHFRIYRNGRLIPSSHYDIKYRNNITSELGVDIKLNKEIGDVIVIDISPIKYNEVLKIDVIPITGLIKTNGILNKPFSLKWYDVYLNGKKLNAGNIDIISPTKFFVYNVESRRNLVIMESNRDNEYFGILDTYMSYNDRLFNEFPGLSAQLIMQNGFIFESEDDIINESVAVKSINMDRFYEYYAKHQPILNPDEEFIPNEIWNQFDDLKVNDTIIMDPDINPDAPSLLEFTNMDEEE